MLDEVKELIDKNIRPYLKNHGGDIEILSVEDGIVKVRLKGACAGCPSVWNTVEDIVKRALVGQVQGIRDVQVDMQVSQDMIEFARKILRKRGGFDELAGVLQTKMHNCKGSSR